MPARGLDAVRRIGILAVSGPIAAREKNFADKPKRRGGRIWTKRPNKVHPEIVKGKAATIKATPQVLKDLGSVADLIEVQAG
jgi:hypothetical protein